MPNGSFYVGNTGDGCPEIEDESVDLSVTSPPYFRADGYTDDLMKRLGAVYARTLKPGARAYMIFGQIIDKLDRPLDAQRAVLEGANGELIAGQTIIWAKSVAVGGWVEQCPEEDCKTKFRTETVSRGHFQPINSPRLLNYCWEYIFCFIKKPDKEAHPMNRKHPDVGVGYADKSNEKRWKSASALHCPGDIWWIPYETTGKTTKKMHRHEFPLDLAKKLVVVSGVPKGSLVFDPFIGGGTTAYAANAYGHHSCGYDLSDAAISALQRDWNVGRREDTPNP